MPHFARCCDANSEESIVVKPRFYPTKMSASQPGRQIDVFRRRMRRATSCGELFAHVDADIDVDVGTTADSYPLSISLLINGGICRRLELDGFYS